ncbi:MAG: hypothetical protein R3B11_02820 [Nitrospira sp.]|nr:hypothetical protein [Nitrospira sp.]MDR4474924.1 hypothetical protein [Nitrospira sp.]
MPETTLHRNPFWLLGATTRDDRRRIVELAETKSFDLAPEACEKSRSDLTTPRARLAVEMAWLPGVSPKKATQLAALVLQDSLFIRKESGLPTLAHINLMAAAFEKLDARRELSNLGAFIQQMVRLVDKLLVDEVIRDVNEDRAISGFPAVKADQVETELVERKRYYCNAIKDALNRLPTSSLIAVMTELVSIMTFGGQQQAPDLIDQLVDSYEVECQVFLHKEAENVQKIIKAARDSAPCGEGAVKPFIDALGTVVRNWDKVAQPIQLSTQARGIMHTSSYELAYSIRSLAIDLFNNYDQLTQSQRITGLLRELFSELPELTERVEQDATALENIFNNRQQDEARTREWAQAITYRVELGTIFKHTLTLSPEGLAWKDTRYPLEAITRIRWGSVRHSINGIPTGTSYTLAFGDDQSEAIVELGGREEIFAQIVEKLWRAVGKRLLIDLLGALQAGGQVRFGEALIRDSGVTLIKHKLLAANEPIHCSWQQIHIWTSDGSFYIGAQDDKKTYVGLSYIHEPNVHILEQALRLAFKRPTLNNLSDLLLE